MRSKGKFFSGSSLAGFDVKPIGYAENEGNLIFVFEVSDFSISYSKLDDEDDDDAWMVELNDRTSNGFCGLLEFEDDAFQFTTGSALFKFKVKSDFEKWLKKRKVYRLGVLDSGCVCYSVSPEDDDEPDIVFSDDIYESLGIQINRLPANMADYL